MNKQRQEILRVLLCGWVAAVCGVTANAITIDDFQVNQALATAPGASTVDHASILGGERDVQVTLIGGAGPISAEVKLGYSEHILSSASTGSTIMTWDGNDNDASTLAFGLGPVNLTTGGDNAFLLGISSLTGTPTITLEVFTSAANWSTFTLVNPTVAPTHLRIPYSAFSVGGGGASFANVAAIRLTISGTATANARLDFLRTGSTTAPTTEVTLTDVVLVDNDANGQASAGDTLRYVLRMVNTTGGTLSNVVLNVPAIANAGAPANQTATPLARDEAPAANSAPGSAWHGAFNTPLTIAAAAGLLNNDFVGTPAATVSSFGGGTFGGGVTDHAAGASAVAAGVGPLTVNADGSLTFTPVSTFTGTFTFQYRLSNSAGSDDATVTLAIGTRPAAVTDAYNVTGNTMIDTTLIPLSVFANDSGDALSVTGNTTPAHGTVSFTAATGHFTYTPAATYTGGDTFTYTIANGFGSVVGTVNLTVANKVWYIDNSVAANGDGRSSSPFKQTSDFSAVNDGGAGHPADNDLIFIRQGSGNYTSSATLRAGQKLIGDGSSGTLNAAFGITFASGSAKAAGTALPAFTGTDPVIVNAAAGGHGIVLSSGNTVRGLTVNNTPNGFGFSGGAVGSLVISESSKTGTGGAINITTSGTFASSVSFDTLESSSSTGHNLSLTNVTGTLNVTSGGTGLAGSAVNASAVNINGGSVSLTYPGTVTKATAGSLVNVSGGHATGTLTFSSTMSATAGDGLQFNNADGIYNFSATVTLNGGDAGVDIVNGSGGNFTFNDTDITNPSGAAFLVSGGGGSIGHAGTITKNNAGHLVDIQSRTGGSVTLTGDLSSTGTSTGILCNGNTGGTITFSGATKTLNTGANTAVTLTSNTGATINFTGGGLDIDTTSATGFSATGGGTISVQGSGNTVDATSGVGLSVANTTISASHVTFQRISSGAAANVGISLDNTGASGGLHVTGLDGGDAGTDPDIGSGGTISGKTGADGSTTAGIGVYLNNTSAVSLSGMQFSNFDNNAIRGFSVTGFTLTDSVINGFSGTTSANADGAISFGTSNPGGANGLFGTSLIDQVEVTGAIEHQIEVYNQSGSFTLTISNCNIHDNSVAFGSDGILSEMQGTATATINILNNTFDDNKSQAVQLAANDSSTITATLDANTVLRSTQGNEGFVLSNGSNGKLTTTISSNNIIGFGGVAIFVGQTAGNANALAGGAVGLRATISGNKITMPTGASNHGMIGFLTSTLGQISQARLLIENNTITNNSTTGVARGIFVSTPDTSTTPNFHATVTANKVEVNDNVAGVGGIAVQATRGTGHFDVRNNDVDFDNGTPAGVNGLRVRQASPGAAELERGVSPLATPVATVLANNNTLSTTEILGTVTVAENNVVLLPSDP